MPETHKSRDDFILAYTDSRLAAQLGPPATGFSNTVDGAHDIDSPDLDVDQIGLGTTIILYIPVDITQVSYYMAYIAKDVIVIGRSLIDGGCAEARCAMECTSTDHSKQIPSWHDY